MSEPKKQDLPAGRAVALRYGDNAAPVVVASGMGYLAEKIVEVAADNGVPVYEDNSLATMLSQLELGQELDAVSAGWSRMIWDGTQAKLVTTREGGNEYYVPDSYQEVTESLEDLHLSVFMDGQSLKDMLSTAEGRTQAMRQIIQAVSVSYDAIGKNPYKGVTLHFEGLRDAQKADYTACLKELRQELML